MAQNITSKLNPKDFVRFFRCVCEITCMHAEFLLRFSSLGEGMLALYKDGIFYTFISRKNEKEFGKKGIGLYSNKEKFTKYMEEFKEYIKKAKDEIISKYKKIPKQMTKEEFIKLHNFLGKLWWHYGFSEFSYQDLAFKKFQQTKNCAIKENLNKTARFKLEHARKIMNAYFFKKGVFENVLEYFSKYGVDGKYLYLDELLALFDGKKISKKIAQQRKKAYAALEVNGKIIKFTPPEALILYKRFTQAVDTNYIKGITANPGLARGRAVIAPLLNDQKIIKAIDAKMKKGDILIAETTSPDLFPLCRKAAAIVAEQGGMLSHAAIVSRELKIPAIIATGIATKVIKDGDMVEVDANKGIVRIIK